MQKCLHEAWDKIDEGAGMQRLQRFRESERQQRAVKLNDSRSFSGEANTAS